MEAVFVIVPSGSRGLSEDFDTADSSSARLLNQLAFVLGVRRGSPTAPRGGILLSAVFPHQPLLFIHLSNLILFLL